ncbi:tryptophan halogenase family protein [Sphingomonas pokkalii]|uniref:Tryptophan halogenase n=1 Tax=Sphingomonas pokkalii TaxID=2175090 RepID=A0A2U0SF58_9SPHN|nr:tryptophan halogenase family protein [Sphingomonas pokkalii]PVX30012.1 tryptophan halogenase [Sphingomonas pokkalii]
MDDPSTIVIAGGGTAGWMAAAALARFAGTGWRIRLIESDAIGTVGVGEATIPQIRLFNAGLGMDEAEFLRATGGTIKLGIEFAGWNGEGSRYLHAFGTIGRGLGLIEFQHYWLRAHAAGTALPFSAYALNNEAAHAGKAARLDGQGPIPAMPYAYHFDAGLYAAFLRRYAEARGVERHEGRIADVERGPAGIAALRLDDGRRIAGDLFIDCTGFPALLMAALGVGYTDWSHWLPCDRAVAVPSARTAPLLPYTRATARGAGWQWRIPLQHRTGNGLVYARAHCSDDEAMATLLANLDGDALTDPRPLRFTTGTRDCFWQANCVALGLAAGFLEPLESTSIHLIQSGIARLLQFLPRGQATNAARAEYNQLTQFEYAAIRDFLVLHYHANGRTEPLWQACRAMALPEELARKIALFRATGRISRREDELFAEPGWLQVLLGQGIVPDRWHPFADQLSDAELTMFLGTIRTMIERTTAAMPSHAGFLAGIDAVQKEVEPA